MGDCCFTGWHFCPLNMQCVCACVMGGGRTWALEEGLARVPRVGGRKGSNRGFFFVFPSCHFPKSPPGAGHCINKCSGRYTFGEKHKYCTWEGFRPHGLPLAPEDPPNIAHGPRQPHGVQAVSLVEAPGNRGPGGPSWPNPHHDWEQPVGQERPRPSWPVAVPSGRRPRR